MEPKRATIRFRRILNASLSLPLRDARERYSSMPPDTSTYGDRCSPKIHGSNPATPSRM